MVPAAGNGGRGTGEWAEGGGGPAVSPFPLPISQRAERALPLGVLADDDAVAAALAGLHVGPVERVVRPADERAVGRVASGLERAEERAADRAVAGDGEVGPVVAGADASREAPPSRTVPVPSTLTVMMGSRTVTVSRSSALA